MSRAHSQPNCAGGRFLKEAGRSVARAALLLGRQSVVGAAAVLPARSPPSSPRRSHGEARCQVHPGRWVRPAWSHPPRSLWAPRTGSVGWGEASSWAALGRLGPLRVVAGRGREEACLLSAPRRGVIPAEERWGKKLQERRRPQLLRERWKSCFSLPTAYPLTAMACGESRDVLRECVKHSWTSWKTWIWKKENKEKKEKERKKEKRRTK